MYNGIGLTTPRGSGTNGYIQRNMSFVHKSKEKINYRSEDDLKKLDAIANKKPNEDILAHEKKRVIELKCLEMQELMEEQGYSEDEMNSKVNVFRQMLLDEDIKHEVPKDQYGRPNVKESHQMAEANQEKNMKLKEALGISQYFVEGSSLDPERKAKEAAAAAAADTQKKYLLVPDSSDSSAEREPEKTARKRKLSTASERTEVSLPGKKKKAPKRHKKERSETPEIKKKKKKKRSEKEKSKYQSKAESSHKRKHRYRSKSSSSHSSSSSSSSQTSRSSSSTTSSSGSRSSSVISLDYGGDRKNVKSKQRRKQGVKNVGDKGHKKGRSSKKSQSPGTVRREDHRSRRDIYEALKKSKHRRNEKRRTTSSGSSSESNSSPEQYYRLEPVLVKHKSKHRRDKHVIEVVKRKKAVSPSVEYKTLDKYEGRRKKSCRTSSSSSDEDRKKHQSKKKKHSISPYTRRHEHHSSEKREMRNIQESVPQHNLQESTKGLKKHRRKYNDHSDNEPSKTVCSHSKDRSRISRSKSLSYSPVKSKHKHGSRTLRNNYSKSPEKHDGERRGERHKNSAGDGKQAMLSSKGKENFGRYKKFHNEDGSSSGNRRSHHKDMSNSSSPAKHNGFHRSQSTRSSASHSPLQSKSRKSHRSRSHSASNSEISLKMKWKSNNLSSVKHPENSSSLSPRNTEGTKNGRREHRGRSNSENSDTDQSLDSGPKNKHRMQKVHNGNKGKRSPNLTKNPCAARSRSRSKSSNHSRSSIKSKTITNQRHQTTRDKIQIGSPVHGISTNEKEFLKKNDPKSKGKQPRSISRNRISAPSGSDIEKGRIDKSKSGNQSPHDLNSQLKSKCSVHEDIVKLRNRNHSGSSADSKFSRKSFKNRGYCKSKSQSPSRDEGSKKSNECINPSKSVSRSRSRSPVEKVNEKKQHSKRRSMSGDRNSKSSQDGSKSWSHESQSKSVSKSPLIDKNSIQEKDNVVSYSKLTMQSPSCCTTTVSVRHSSKESKSRSSSKDKSPAHSEKSSCKRISIGRTLSRSPSVCRKSRSLSPVHSKFPRERSHSRSISPQHSKDHSHSSSRSKSCSRSSSTSSFKSHSKSYSRSRSHSKSYSRSHSRSSSSRSRSRSKSGARSPSIPRRRGSPSFLDKRRITS